ncbi:MAG TPA: DUF1080 domain-containing protein [Flavitalea sp.]|nr:DUF1080 domain-containing protein [Flavitalea sp.]
MNKIVTTSLQRFLLPLIVVISTIAATSFISKENTVTFADALEGRWDITIQGPNKELPSWLEVRHSGLHTLVGYFVGVSGSARPVSKITLEGNKFNLSLPPQWDEGKDLVIEGTVDGDKLSGTMINPDGKNLSWTAVRAPSLHRQKQPVWGTPIKLFNGVNLDGWKATAENQWIASAGVLKSPKSGANLFSTRTFNDFKLHVEFRYPKGSNSGIYLRGRYEVQVMDSKGVEPTVGDFGAIYGFIIPSEMMAKEPNTWQAYDITLIGRRVTVVANGKTIICNEEIPGITGGALDSHEAEPGPIYFQGDHGPVEYRNIVITPAR